MDLKRKLGELKKLADNFDFNAYERMPGGSREDDAFSRNVEVLTFEQMAKIADVPIEMIQRWVRHGQIDPLRHAASQPVQLPDLERAKAAAKEGVPFVPRFAKQPAQDVFITFLLKPIGLQRLLSLEHRREMQNYDRGLPVWYIGPGDPIKDELVTDMHQAQAKGDSAVDVALNQVNPKLHDERAAKREVAQARP